MLKNSEYFEVDHISVSRYQEILLRQPPQHRERVNLRCCRGSKNAEEQGAGSRGFLLSHVVINNHPKIFLFSFCLLPGASHAWDPNPACEAGSQTPQCTSACPSTRETSTSSWTKKQVNMRAKDVAACQVKREGTGSDRRTYTAGNVVIKERKQGTEKEKQERRKLVVFFSSINQYSKESKKKETLV